jgi:protein-tyrosine phosphatase
MVRALKQRIYDGWWWWRGRRLANPVPPSPTRRVLFLCQGNICRSPFAAALAARHFLEAGLDHVDVVSAGLRASQAPESPPDAVTAAAAHGVRLDGHRARDVTPAQMADADVIVVMEVRHLDHIRLRYPASVARVHLLPLYERPEGYGPLERVNLTDPFARGPEAFVRCYGRIAAALPSLTAAIQLACQDGPTSAGRAGAAKDQRHGAA